MNKLCMLLSGAAVLPASLFANEPVDSVNASSDLESQLDEVVVSARRSALKDYPDRLIYMVKNDPYARGLNAVELLDRIPRVSVINDLVSVAGKNSVRYIVDGHLLEMPADAIALKLKNLQAEGIEKIELLATPPARYAAADNVAYISIVTRNESLGTKGSLWGRGSIRERFSYGAGGNISHTTRKVELSADLGWNDDRGINDICRKYVFEDHLRTSVASARFKWRNLVANGMFRYKFDSRWSAGIIANFSAMPIENDKTYITADRERCWKSGIISPARPDNSFRFTAFADWAIDTRGKMLSLTYNFFDRDSRSYAEINTLSDTDCLSRLNKDAANIYRIHSVRLDATLPFDMFRLEAGAAYSGIDNNTDLRVSDYDDGFWIEDPTQSNRFGYDEKTVAAYVSVERSFNSSLFGKVSLRYEHTNVRGVQYADNSRHDRSYGYFFPSVAFSWNTGCAGRFSLDYSMGIARPSFGDLNPFRYYNTVTDYFTGNPDLEPGITHNVGLNYSFMGIYAVLYGSWKHNGVGYINRFGADGMQWTMPENCLNTVKAGLYASYNRSLFDWWNLNAGGEIFYSETTSKSDELRDSEERSWSGKLELNTSWMLNRKKTLILNLKVSHFFPYQDGMFRFENRTLIGCDIRYMLLDNRLVLSASVSDPFGWSVSKSTARYRDYTLRTRTDIHSHAVSFRISWSFGRKNVSNVYRDTKERESQRSY